MKRKAKRIASRESQKPASLVPWQARQGDVLLERRAEAPIVDGLKEIPRDGGGVVLAYGEVTGHKHQLRDANVCQLRNETTGERVLLVDVSGLLEHEEHMPPLPVAPGAYEVVQQCEWDWYEEAGRVVAD